MVKIDRPYITCHMMCTIDGKIASGIEGVDILDDYFDLYTQIESKLGVNAWLCGRVTASIFAKEVNAPLTNKKSVVTGYDFKAEDANNSFFITIDTKGILRWNDNKIRLSNQKHPSHLIVIVTKKTPIEYFTYLRYMNISYLTAGENEVEIAMLCEKLKKIFDINNLLLEGGALTNGFIMAHEFVDEISLLLTPIVLNKENSPSLFERKTDEIDVKKYKLIEVKKIVKDCVWLRYKLRH